MTAQTSTLDRFLSEISRLLRTQDGAELCSYLIIEPPYSNIYNALIVELRASYARSGSNNASNDALELKVHDSIPEARDGQDGATTWTAFIKFMSGYLGFLRDVDINNLYDTYGLLSELLGKANSALTHPTMGALILPTVFSYSRMLARLAIGLDKQPHLIAHLIPHSDSDDSGPRETLPERAANTIRQAFVTCLNDRSSSAIASPEGRKRGIYTLANLCLKILFACHKIRNAAQIFENIYNQSPPLTQYSRAERVTYLFYLGRFLWANGHAYRAMKALEAAWSECHSTFLKQKRLLLVYLIASNLICGRFPSAALLQRPEAQSLSATFVPLCRCIAKGNLAEFRRLLSPGSAEYERFAAWSIDVQLRNRCEVLVWRSLVRRAFLICGDQGDPQARKAPTLDLRHLVTIWQWQDRVSADPQRPASMPSYIDPDFEGLPNEANGEPTKIDMTGVMSKMSSLVHQDLLNGYLSYKVQKFAIQGARQRGALAAGFPLAWAIIKARQDDEVPGWKQTNKANNRLYGPGTVLNLSGLKAIGAVE